MNALAIVNALLEVDSLNSLEGAPEPADWPAGFVASAPSGLQFQCSGRVEKIPPAKYWGPANQHSHKGYSVAVYDWKKTKGGAVVAQGKPESFRLQQDAQRYVQNMKKAVQAAGWTVQ